MFFNNLVENIPSYDINIQSYIVLWPWSYACRKNKLNTSLKVAKCLVTVRVALSNLFSHKLFVDMVLSPTLKTSRSNGIKYINVFCKRINKNTIAFVVFTKMSDLMDKLNRLWRIVILYYNGKFYRQVS